MSDEIASENLSAERASFDVLFGEECAMPPTTTSDALQKAITLAQHSDAVQTVHKRCTAKDPEFSYALPEARDGEERGLVYSLFLPAEATVPPEDVFGNLRWGGRVFFASHDEQALRALAQRYRRWDGFVLDMDVQMLRGGLMGLPLPIGKKTFYFAARKIDLIRPGQSSDRFTYHVQLTRQGGQWVVVKRVPTLDRVMARLREKFPDAAMDDIRRRAQKFTEKIFPVFLTREAAMLKILQQHLPEEYANRVPKCLGVECDNKGFVRTLYMNWMRNGGKGLSQLEFALQTAELLSVMHDKIGVIHLDLRLDNFVITDKGVGFIDFGSAVRAGETFADNSLLSTLFEEMMRTSQIQRMLGHMKDNGLVTSRVLSDGHHKVDKAVDIFYMAVQMNKPHGNPDFKGLVRCNARTLEARHIKRLTEEVLRPADVSTPLYRSATDILEGLRTVAVEVAAGHEPPPPPSKRVTKSEDDVALEAVAAAVSSGDGIM